MLEFAYKRGHNYEKYRSKEEVLKSFEFSSTKKMMTTLVKISKTHVRVFVKGSPEAIIERCQFAHSKKKELLQYAA